jgi:Skp family chaperone for outer membrane proteins
MTKVSLMKQLFAFGAGAIVVALASAHPRSAAPSVITVSLQRVATQSNSGKKAIQQLETLRQERGRDLAVKQKELEGVLRQLSKGDALPAAERERLSQDDTRRRTELQQLTAQANADFQSAQARLLSDVRAQLAPILADIAKRSGIDVVLNSDSAVAWAAPGSDVTDEVLQRLNAPPQ